MSDDRDGPTKLTGGRGDGDIEDRDASDEEMDAWLEGWAQVDQSAAEYLQAGLAQLGDWRLPGPERDRAEEQLRRDLREGGPAARFLIRANGWTDELPETGLWVAAVASTISPPEDPGTSAEEQSWVAALQHADWLGLVLGLVRRGVGTRLDPARAQRDVEELADVEGEIEDPAGHLHVLSGAIEALAPLWQSLGILDDDRRLTALGRWGLPVALLRTWTEPLPEPETLAPDVEQAALALLAAGARSLEDLRKDLARQGWIVSSEGLRRGLVAHRDVWQFQDDTLGHVPTLLQDIIVVHVLDDEEVRLGLLDGGVDLDVWVFLADDGGIPLAGGGRMTLRWEMHGYEMPGSSGAAFAGPDGWLDGFAAGDLIGTRYRDGVLHLERFSLDGLQELDYGDEAVALARVFEETVAEDEEYGEATAPGVSGAELVFRMRREHPESLRQPVPPLNVLASVLGYDVQHGYVCRPGARWGEEEAPSWFTKEQREVWRRWSAITETWSPEADSPDPDALAALVSDLDRVHLVGFVAHDVVDDPGLDPLLQAMQGAVDGRLVAVPMVLRAAAAEALGDVGAQRAHLEAAVAADSQRREALCDLGDLASIAGDAREADRLYRLGGLTGADDELKLLQPFLQPPLGGPGRNKPCPCGSGKKYKMCHGRTDIHPLPNRAPWLWRKLCMYAQRPPQRSDILEWGALLAGTDREDAEAVAKAMADSLAHDFAIVDGGLLQAFLDTMGDTLPADEHELAQRWIGQPMRLMEIRRVSPMRGVVAVDLLTGEELEIVDRRLSQGIREKDLLLGRPLDDGSGTLRLQSPPFSIPRRMRARLLQLLRQGAPAEELAAALAPRMPTLQTTDGQELIFCTARYHVGDLDKLWSALAAELGADAGDERLHLLNEGGTVLGSARRERGRVVLETLAVERMRALQEILLRVEPSARLVDESTRPFDPASPPAEFRRTRDDSKSELELSAEDIEGIRRKFEDDWLDEHIPALDGLTPYEAANGDRRDDLMALLDDFDWEDRQHPNPMGMDTARLRRELGLDT